MNSRRRDIHDAAVLLRDQGLTHEKIAERLGYSRQHVSEILRDPEARDRRRRYWNRLTPLQRATSRMEEP